VGYREVVAAYESEQEIYQRLAVFVESALAEAVKMTGVHAQSGRRYTNPLAEIEDKAGVRVVVIYERDVDTVVSAALCTFDAGTPDRKVDALEYDKNGYLGTHIVAKLTEQQVADTCPEFAGRVFEIQVRTMAQGAWAEVSHAQLYKPPADVPNALKRHIYRLVALVELFDSEVEAFLRDAATIDGYREATALARMTEVMANLGNTRSPDRRLTSKIAAALVPLYNADPSAVARIVEEFAQTREVGLRNIVAEAEQLEEQDVNPLLAQPELPLICERLEIDRVNLEHAWPPDIPFEWLDDLAEKWGLGRTPA
jgi:ppGpp synthetase/RelA/SpoT-type nucleotidyltranferase